MEKSPVRILCVFATLNRGGAETMCMELYRHIDRNKVQFDFIKHTSQECAFDEEIKQLGGRIYVAPKFKGYNYFQYVTWWKAHLSQHPEHQIIHGHFFTLSPVYFPICLRYGRITVGHSHITRVTERNIKAFVKNKTNMLIEKYSDYRLACSADAGRYIFPHKDFTVLNNAIDAVKYRYNSAKRNEFRGKYGLENKFVIGHVGRFDTQKNHTFILDIFSAIKRMDDSAVLVLIGDGPLKAETQEKAAALGLEDSVMFLGVRTDVPDLLQMMDVLLFPSLYEGLGIAAIEAQAAGLQVVCSDVIPHEVKVTHLVEFVSLEKPAKYWADTVLKYKNMYVRHDTYEQIVAAGYDIHTTAKWLQEFYLNIIKQSAE